MCVVLCLIGSRQHLLQPEVPCALCGKGCGQGGPCRDPLEEQCCYHWNRQCYLPHPSGSWDSSRLPGTVLHCHLEIPGRQTQRASKQVRQHLPPPTLCPHPCLPPHEWIASIRVCFPSQISEIRERHFCNFQSW